MKSESPAPDAVGLCRTCQWGERITSSRGADFWLCGRSFEEPEFPKYPRLPVLVCRGYEKK
jgi:hypothetical protein